jgi:hypothetical protein
VRLQSALTANLPVKITSVALSVFLWFLAAGEENATTLLPVNVAIRAPSGRTILGTPGPLHALVVGPRREVLKLSATPLSLSRTLPDTTLADEVRLDLDPGDLQVPPGVSVHVQDVQPHTLVVTLDSTFQRIVPVRAVVRMMPETGFALGAISVIPGTVRLLGSRARVEAIDSVRTEPLEIDEAKGSVEDVVRLDTSDFGTVRAMPAEVGVRVSVDEEGQRTIGGVPVRLTSATALGLRPDRATVRVQIRGAESRLAAMTVDSVLVVLDRDRSEPGSVRLKVIAPSGVVGRAEPDSVELVPRGAHG